MAVQNCAYCMEGELVAAFGIKICELPTSKVYLFKEQSHKGRVIVAHKQHVSEIVELSTAERAAYFEDVNHVAEALHKAFHPQKINYGAYGDTGHFFEVLQDDDFVEVTLNLRLADGGSQSDRLGGDGQALGIDLGQRADREHHDECKHKCEQTVFHE